MKIFKAFYHSKMLRRNSAGFTLAELVVAMAVGGMVFAAVLAVMVQLFHGTTANSNYMAAFRQVQNGGDWISRDALMAQQVHEMADTELSVGIDDSQDSIPVNSTDGFPSSGVISIDDELIQYSSTSATGDAFEGCTRGGNATAHDDGKAVTSFVALGWTLWDGSQHQVVYNLKESNNRLMRSYLAKGVSEASYSLVSSTIVAQAIDPVSTSSSWDYDAKELRVEIAASVGDFILWKTGTWESTATRVYQVNPRPFF